MVTTGTNNTKGTKSKLDLRLRLGALIAVAALVLGMAVWLVRPVEQEGAGVQYTVDMSRAGFRPATLVMPAGRVVSVRLNNVDSPFQPASDGALHQFAVDELGIDVRLDALKSRVITLPPLKPGTYTFYCDVCCGGTASAIMLGTLIVHDEAEMAR